MKQMIEMDFAEAEARVMGSIFDGLTMTSREIAKLTEKEHKHVMRDIKVLISNKAIGRSNFGQTPYIDPQNKQVYTEYTLDFKATYVLILGYDAVRRAAVIDRWMELEDERARAKKPTFQLPDFTNPATAARAWADEVEAKQMLQSKITEDAPKVAYAEAVDQAKGALTLSQTAKSFKIGPQKFIQFLKDTDRIFKHGAVNLPLQSHVDSGTFRVRPITYGYTGKMTTQTVVTPKGQRVLFDLVQKHRRRGTYSHLIGTI